MVHPPPTRASSGQMISPVMRSNPNSSSNPNPTPTPGKRWSEEGFSEAEGQGDGHHTRRMLGHVGEDGVDDAEGNWQAYEGGYGYPGPEEEGPGRHMEVVGVGGAGQGDGCA